MNAKSTTLLSLLPFSLALCAVGCELPDELTDDNADTSGATPDDGGDDDETGSPDDGTGGDDGGSDDGDDDSDGADDDGESGGTPAGPFGCGEGRLIAGNPFGDPSVAPVDGAASVDPNDTTGGIAARRVQASPVDPNMLAIASGPEIWFMDTGSDTIHHMLGDREAGQFRPGPCDVARVGIVSDLDFTSDGTLILGDHSGNAVVRVTDPFGPACEMHLYAGNQLETSTGPLPHEPGFDDGPAAAATFSGPDMLEVGADDTIYVVDKGNAAIRAIAPDGEVSTVAVLPSTYISNGLSVFGIAAGADGMIYLSAKGSVQSSQNATILELDPSDGEVREVATGRDDPWLIGSTGPTIAGMVEVRPGLVATYVNGRVFTIATDGTVEHVAGDGDKPWTITDYAADYDPFAVHDAMELELDNHSATTTGLGAFVSWTGDSLIVTGQASGFVTVEIGCQ